MEDEIERRVELLLEQRVAEEIEKINTIDIGNYKTHGWME